MPLCDAVQPETVFLSEDLRLRKYDGVYENFLRGYQDPAVYQNSEGIFDEGKIPDLNYVQRMCDYLARAGELYYIEILDNGAFRPIGDVTVKPENPPIAIWEEACRGRGVGRKVLEYVMIRLKSLGYEKITGSTVYSWNVASQRLHEALGFRCVAKDGREWTYEKIL